MDKVLDFVNTKLNFSFKYDTCKKVLDNWQGATIFLVSSKDTDNLYLGYPVFIKDIKGTFTQIKSPKEMLKIMAAIQSNVI